MGPAGRLVTIRRSGADGAHFPLSLSTCLFGRGIECDIRIQLPVVSRQHCKIEVNERKAVLFNFSSANPTQVNGSAIDGPVQLKHGDVITVIDRSFRYEDDHHQGGSTSAEFPGQRHGQATPRRGSRSGCSSDPDGEVEGRGAARSQLTEEGVSEEPLAPTEGVGVALAVSRSSGGPATRSPAGGHRLEPLGDDHKNAAGPPARRPGEGSRGTLVSRNGGPEVLPSPWCLEKDGEEESPFRKLYESMKEKLDVKSEKENVLQNRRKSGSHGHCTADSESVGGGSWGETPLQGSPKSRRRSRRSSQTKAVPAPGQREEERTGQGPGPTLEATASPSVPPMETMEGSTPVQCSHQNSSRKRRSGGQSSVRGSEPLNPEQTAACAPEGLFLGHGAPSRGESAAGCGDTPERVFSRKRRSSLSTKVGILATETEIPKPAVLTPLLVQVKRKVPGSSLGPTPLLGAAAGCPGLSSTDSSLDESMHEMEGVPLKTRRVSFGGRLRPELFDENLPPNTPLKKGETPMKRRSLATPAPAVLKKIIKGQPQDSGKEDSSEIRLEVTAQNVSVSSPACCPAKSSPVANDGRRRSSKPPSRSASQSPPQTDVPKRGGRRSSGLPSQRASGDRGQHGTLQMIQSRRRSGASEANLMVAKSWADVVKLSAKHTQARTVKRGPPRPLGKRKRRANTPKKPTGHVYNEFSTGHANSPCTIVIGKAHVEKVTVPAQPYRMLNSFVFNKKVDFNEDLSGLTEMFKTPAKEKPKKMSLRLTAFSNSEGLFGNQFQVPKSEEKLLCTPAKFGENVFPSAQNAPEEPSDKNSASPALRRQYMTVNKHMKTPTSETEPSKTASSVNRSRRSVGLRNAQVPGTECEKEDPESDAVESILGNSLRKSPVQAQLIEREMKESEGASATGRRNLESKENSEERRVMGGSRRSSKLKCAPTTDVIATKRLQDTESKEGLVGTWGLLQTPGRAQAPMDKENKATVRRCRSPEPEPVSTLSKMNVRIKTPSQSVSAEALSVLRKPTQTPGDTKHTHIEPLGGDESLKASKKFPEQQRDPAEHVTGSRRSRTPKRKFEPTEDLTGFKELFQTPNHIVEPMTEDKTMKTPSKSPKPEPVSTLTNTKRRLRTPLGKMDVEEEPLALRESTPTPGETTGSPGDPEGDGEDIGALKATPEQKRGSAEHVSGRRRRSRTPKRKVQPTEDLSGFKELFQTPSHTVEPVTEDKTMKTPSRSPKPEPVSTLSNTKRCLRTPLGKMHGEEEFSGPRKLTQTSGKMIGSPRDSEGDDEDIGAWKATPEQKRGSAEHVTGSRKRSRTPTRKVEPTEDLAGFKELFQTPNHVVETVTNDKTTKILSKSPKPEPVSTPSSTKRHLRTPLGKMDVEEEPSAPRESTPTLGETTGSPGDPEGDEEDIRALKATPEQKRGSAEHVTGSRRRSRTPKRKVQPTEDLAGFKELFQTPNHIVEPMTEDKTMKIPNRSPEPEPVSTLSKMNVRIKTPSQSVSAEALSVLRKPTQTPGDTRHTHIEPLGGDKSLKASKNLLEQQQDPAEHVTGSRRSRTSKKNSQPTEDLAGFKELFQTPNHTDEPMTKDVTSKATSKSPKPEPVSTPTSTKRHLRTPLGKVDVEEEFSGPRKPTPTPGETTGSPGDSEGDDEDIGAWKATPEQKRGSAEHVTGSRKRSRTPTRKVEPTEDLTGFKELFQTPNHVVETVTNDKTTKILSKSPKPEPVSTPSSTKRHLRTPLGKMDVEEEPSAPRKSTPTPGETTGSPGDPEGDEEDIGALKATPEQKRGSAEHVSGSRRRSRTPKRKVQPTEDLSGFKELFQTPNHTDEPITEDITSKTPSKSPKPEPVSTPTSTKRHLRAPLGKVDVEEEPLALRESTPTPGETTGSPGHPEGDDEDIRALKATPEQKRGSAEHVSGSRKRSRTPKRKFEPTEDSTGFKELFQTPNHIVEPVTEDKTMKTPSKSPKPEPVSTLTNTKRRLRTPLGKMDVEEEPLALRESTPTPGETTGSPGHPEGDDEDIGALKATPEQKRGSAEHVSGSRRRSRTPTRVNQPVEDLVGFKELFQTPRHRVESVIEDKATKMPCKSAQAKPAVMPTGRNRRLKAPPGKVAIKDEHSVLWSPTRASRKTTRSNREPEGGDKDMKLFKESPEQKLLPSENVTASKRRPRTRKEKAQFLADPDSLNELLQIPNHTEDTVAVANTTEMASGSPQAEAVMPARTRRQLKAPPGTVVVREEPSALRRPRGTSGKTMRSHREPEGADKEMKLFKESPEQKLLPAENVTASKRRPRTRKEKAQFLADPDSLNELLQIPNHTEDTVAVANTTEMASGSPQAEVVVPAKTRRQLKAPPETVVVREEPLALRRPRGTSGKTTRSHREPEGGDKDMKLFKESPEQKLLPAENVTASKRRPRTRKEKAQFLADPDSLNELLQIPNHTEDTVAVANTTEMASGSPQAEAVMPARTRRQLKAPPGTVVVREEPSALRRPRGTSGKTTRSLREPVDGAKDIKVCKGSPRREPGPVGNVGSGRLLRLRKGKAQPPHSPADSKQLLQSPAPDKKLGTDTAGVTRTSTQTPDQSKPVTMSRRALRAPNTKPTEELVDSRDPVKSQSEGSIALSPKRKREDGSCTGPGGLRPRTRTQDAAEAKPPQKRQRMAPREQCAPPEPSNPRKGRRVLREGIEPVDDLPGANRKTKNKGREEDVTSPDKGVSMCPSLPNKTKGAGQGPELLIPAEKGQRKRNEKKPGKSSQEVEIQNPEGAAQNSAPGDQVHERRRSPRPGRRGKVPVPRGAEEKAQASSVDIHGKAREEKEGAPRTGFICLRSRKVTVPPTGDTLESQSKQRVTRSAKRPAEDADKENDACVKKMRTRSRRGQ